MLVSPEEVIKTIKQVDETPTQENESPTRGELKPLFLRLGLDFGNKDKQQKKTLTTKEPKKNSDENSSRPFASFFDTKSSLFSKMSAKTKDLPQVDKPPAIDESNLTVA